MANLWAPLFLFPVSFFFLFEFLPTFSISRSFSILFPVLSLKTQPSFIGNYEINLMTGKNNQDNLKLKNNPI